MKNLVEIFTKRISATGLGVFRIAYGFNLLLEIINLYNYRQLYFDKLPYLDPHFPDTSIILLLWMLVILFLILGFFTKVSSILNYIFTLVFLSSAISFEYHMFYVYAGMNFLMIFLPIHAALSIDVVRKKLKAVEQNLEYVPLKVSKLNYLIPVFIGLGLVYIDSVIYYKIQSPMWLRGLGLWLPSSLPQITISNNQWFLNQELLVKSLSYLTMAFEFMFVFLFWNKKFRIPLLLIGIGLHIGIFIEYPIPYFAFGCLTVYFLMVPVFFWGRFWQKVTRKKQSLTIFYNDLNKEANKFKIIVKSFDILNQISFVAKGKAERSKNIPAKVWNEQIVGVDIQGNFYEDDSLIKKITSISPLYYPLLWIKNFRWLRSIIQLDLKTNDEAHHKIMIDKNQLDVSNRSTNVLNAILIIFACLSVVSQIQVHHSFFSPGTTTYKMDTFLVKGFGITKHPVFMDDHFKGYHNLYGVKYKNKFLPILDENGMADSYIRGGTWVNWMWRVNMPYVKENSYLLRKGMINYTSFWAHQNDINLLDNHEFEIVRKKIKVPFKWEKDLLKKNIESPWETVGKLSWKQKKPSFVWNSPTK